MDGNMSKKYCLKCKKYKCKETEFKKTNMYCNVCTKPVKKYHKDAPECTCGGKVLSSNEEQVSGPSRDAFVWMCCSCGSKLGRYDNGVSIGPDDIISAHERPDLSAKYETRA